MIYLDQVRAAEAPAYPAGYSFVCLDCGVIYPLKLGDKGCPACGSRAKHNAAKVHGDVRAVVVGPPTARQWASVALIRALAKMRRPG